MQISPVDGFVRSHLLISKNENMESQVTNFASFVFTASISQICSSVALSFLANEPPLVSAMYCTELETFMRGDFETCLLGAPKLVGEHPLEQLGHNVVMHLF